MLNYLDKIEHRKNQQRTQHFKLMTIENLNRYICQNVNPILKTCSVTNHRCDLAMFFVPMRTEVLILEQHPTVEAVDKINALL